MPSAHSSGGLVMKSTYFFLFVAVFALLSSSVVIGQESNVAEPEYIGVVYNLDSSGKMQALDRQRMRYKAGLRALGFGGAKVTADLEGKSAALRVPSDTKISFVVQLPYGSDPRKIQLFSFVVKDGNRQIMMTSGSIFKGYNVALPIQLNITRFGQNSYKLTPAVSLAVGEYAFIAENSNELFCFGVDKKD
jgi:hypothetical protein